MQGTLKLVMKQSELYDPHTQTRPSAGWFVISVWEALKCVMHCGTRPASVYVSTWSQPLKALVLSWPRYTPVLVMTLTRFNLSFTATLVCAQLHIFCSLVCCHLSWHRWQSAQSVTITSEVYNNNISYLKLSLRFFLENVSSIQEVMRFMFHG